MPDEPTPPPADDRPLIDQMFAEMERLIERDAKLRAYERRAEDIRYKAEALRREVRFRHTYLRRVAAKIIRERYGIRVIPGYNDIGTNVAREVGRLSAKTRQLFEEAGIQLPPALQQPPKKTNG